MYLITTAANTMIAMTSTATVVATAISVVLSFGVSSLLLVSLAIATDVCKVDTTAPLVIDPEVIGVNPLVIEAALVLTTPEVKA